MSTTTTNMARSTFSTAAFAQLVRRLRHTNARYNQIACQFRCRIRPTHHARRRAYRAGLRIDTSKARACPEKYVSVHPPPVLDTSVGSPGWAATPAEVYATANAGIVGEDHRVGQADAYMRGSAQRNPPEAVVRKHRRRGGRQRIVLRLPPLKLQLDVDRPSVSDFTGPVPGAPRLLPRQLPDDECGVEEMMLGPMSCSSSSTNESDLPPFGVQVYSGLCITIPPRSLKRKLQDMDTGANDAVTQQPKRILRTRWNESQRQ